jgi:hypothetical protein
MIIPVISNVCTGNCAAHAHAHTRTRTRKRSFFEMHMWSFHPLVYLFSLEIDSEARELDHPLLDPRQGEPRVALQDLTQELSDDVI